MDIATVLVALVASLNPHPAPLDVSPPPLPPSLRRASLPVNVEARTRARAELRRWRAEQRRIKREKAERAEREAARATAARTAEATASYGGGVERWRGLVSRYFSGHVDEALYVIRGESSGDPRADNGTCRGLFQVHEVHAAKFEIVTGLPYFWGVYEPDANVRFAAYLSGGGTDWSAWSVRP